MQRTKILFALMMMLTLTCNLNAQDASSEKTNEPAAELAEQLTNTDDADNVAGAVDELDSAIEGAEDTDADGSDVEESEAVDELNVLIDDDEKTVDDEGEDVEDKDESEDEGEDEDHDEDEDENEEDDEEVETGPITVRVNENGELVGQTTADVGGDWVPVEANVALVANGVLLKKIVAEQDGSFAFPNIAPGDYNLCGSASSYCGQQALTVVSQGDCRDNVDLRLSQSEQSCCYSQLGSAPAATFAGGTGGFSSGGGAFAGGGGGFASGGGGGFATGGGAAGGFSRLRLLGIGGIATAIAVGVSDGDDVASPAN